MANNMSEQPAAATIVLLCKKGAGEFADYPDIEVMQRINAALVPFDAVVGVTARGGMATIRADRTRADAVLASIVGLPGVLFADLET